MLSRISRSTTTKFNVAEDSFNRLAMAADFESVLEDWQQPCAQEGISLSKNVIAEFKKKIKEAGLAGTAAHLDLRHGLLNARQISLLILVLSKKPVISRLEVRAEEVTNEALEAIEYVLQLQIKSCREIDLDNRLQACYLGDFILDGKTAHLDQQLLNKVQQSCAVLKYANARAFIRATYLDDNASAQSKSTVQNSYVEKLWGKIFGILDSPRIQKAYRSARIGTKEWIRYNELERILVCGFIERGSLVDIGEELMESVDCTSNEQHLTSPLQSCHELREQFSSPIIREVKSSSAGGSSNVDNLARKLAEIEAMSADQKAFFPVDKKSIPHEERHEQLDDDHMDNGDEKDDEEEEEEMRPLDDGDEYDKESENYKKQKEIVPETKIILEKPVAADAKPPIVPTNNSSAASMGSKLSQENSFLDKTVEFAVEKPLPGSLSSTSGNGGLIEDVLPAIKHSSGDGISSIEAKLLELEAMMKSDEAPLITTNAMTMNNNSSNSNTFSRQSSRSNVHDSAPDVNITVTSSTDTNSNNSKNLIETESLTVTANPFSTCNATLGTTFNAQDTETKETSISSSIPPYIDESINQKYQIDTATVGIEKQLEIMETKNASLETEVKIKADLPLISYRHPEQQIIVLEEATATDSSPVPVIKEPVIGEPVVSVPENETSATVSLPTNTAPIVVEEVSFKPAVTTLPVEQTETAIDVSDVKENKETTKEEEEKPKENVFSKWKKMSQQYVKQSPLPVSPQNISKYITGLKKYPPTESLFAGSSPVNIASEEILATLKSSVHDSTNVQVSEAVLFNSEHFVETEKRPVPVSQGKEINDDIATSVRKDAVSFTYISPSINTLAESVTNFEIPSVFPTSNIATDVDSIAVIESPSLPAKEVAIELSVQNITPEIYSDQVSEPITVARVNQVEEESSHPTSPTMISSTVAVELSLVVPSTVLTTTTSSIATTAAVQTKSSKVVPIPTTLKSVEQRKSKVSSSSPAKLKAHNSHSHTGGHSLSLGDYAFTNIGAWSNIISEEDSQNISELFLPNNRLSSLSFLTLAQQFQHLRICDLSNNLLRGKIETHDFPLTLTSLNISHNKLVDIYGITACASLKSLNVSHNLIKNLFGIPGKLEVLDISFNKIFAVNSVRSLMLSTKLTNLSIDGNPVMDAIANPRIYLTSFLYNLQVLNGRRLIPEKRKAPEVYHPVSTIGYHPGNIAFAERPAIHRSPPRPKRSTSPTKLTLVEQQQQIEKLCSDKKNKPPSDNHFEGDFKAKKSIKILPTKELDKVVNRLSAPRQVILKKEDDTINLSLNSKAAPKVVIAGGKIKSSNAQHHQQSEVTSSIESLPSYSIPSVNKNNNKRLSSSAISASKTKSIKVSVPDQVELWLQQKKEQLQSVADIFRIPFGMSKATATSDDNDNDNTLDAKALAAFDGCVENTKIYLEIPLFIRKAIKNDLIDQALLRSVDEVMTQMDKALALLQQIQTVGLIACIEDDTGAITGYSRKQYSKALEIMMHSPAGQFVNDAILKPHNCAYQPSVTRNEQPNDEISRRLQQGEIEIMKKLTPTKASNVNNLSLSSPQILIKDKNNNGNISEQEGEFSHHIRDVQQDEDNNNHSRRVLQTVLFPVSEESDTDSLSFNKQHSVQPSGNSTSSSRNNFDPSPFMDRMRQRISRKFIPSVYLEANEPTGFAVTEDNQDHKQEEREKGIEGKQAIASSVPMKMAYVRNETVCNNRNAFNSTISIDNNNVVDSKHIMVAQEEAATAESIEETSIPILKEKTVTSSVVAKESSVLDTKHTDKSNVATINIDSNDVKKEEKGQALPSKVVINTEESETVRETMSILSDTFSSTMENVSQEMISFKSKETEVQITPVMEKKLITETSAIFPLELLPPVILNVETKTENLVVVEQNEINNNVTTMIEKEEKNQVGKMVSRNDQQYAKENTFNNHYNSYDSNNDVLAAEQEKPTVLETASNDTKKEDNINRSGHNMTNVMIETSMNEFPRVTPTNTDDSSHSAISFAKTTPPTAGLTSENILVYATPTVVSSIPIIPSLSSNTSNTVLIQNIGNISNNSNNTTYYNTNITKNDTNNNNITNNSNNISAKAPVVPVVAPTAASASMSNVDRFRLRMQLQREKSNVVVAKITSAENTITLNNENSNNNAVDCDTPIAASAVSPTQSDAVSSNRDLTTTNNNNNSVKTDISVKLSLPLPTPTVSAPAIEEVAAFLSVARPPYVPLSSVRVPPAVTPSANDSIANIINNSNNNTATTNTISTTTNNAAMLSPGGRSFADRLTSLRSKEQQQVQMSPVSGNVYSSTMASSHPVDNNNKNNNYTNDYDIKNATNNNKNNSNSNSNDGKRFTFSSSEYTSTTPFTPINVATHDATMSTSLLPRVPRDTERDMPPSAQDTPSAVSAGYQSDRSQSYVSGSDVASRTDTTTAEDEQSSLPASTVSFATAATVVSARDRLRARLAKNKQQQHSQDTL